MDTSGAIVSFSDDRFGQLRTFTDNADTWFVASDVAKALGYRDAEKMTRRLDDDEKGTRSVGTLGGEQRMTVINEAGLYAAVLGSKVDGAKAFKRWVTHDVLPAIRRTGGYMVSRPDETPEQTMARALLLAKETMDRQSAEIGALTAEVRDMLPKAAMAESLIECDGTYTVTEAARLLRQVDGSMSRRRLFERLRSDGMVEKRGNAATARAVERGYLVNTCPSYTAPDGTRVIRAPYALVTPKGLAWASSRYCVPQRQLALAAEGAA